ncbi:hypothetical protein HBH56_078640 [Parastagonospora nodorum]|uniref:Glycan binding protein Y3-like domain-containing protein n=1 Tax=Phaeosphaeria nodorum (strain SN15 / ATCC MYA-4574 / FGSC 10173) TaxID=321614 RepID=A0A7U2ICA1_PHANO|nr:hypothetical protein HBH56_078640 [Parastagonospora nodorum]QRD07040.1 hypothetical protein JI435_446780 [Parastagonospora nodorum SN15]KAH3923371.1 hypothetical protein HBH54_209310 [Parastagonospora nodorum]KAH4139322.1 hypothetical protein HBH45_096110 [Parastagonospora nodorum]KAH4166326.1 hypothetical protein HBH44_057270 [Parastagonospora nodorum]
MHLLALFSFIATTIVAVPHNCYPRGEWWSPDYGHALDAVEDVCNTLADEFEPNETKYRCINSNKGHLKFEFWTQNAKTGYARVMEKSLCVHWLQLIVSGCWLGGTVTRDGWYYRADPNHGRCGSLDSVARTTI